MDDGNNQEQNNQQQDDQFHIVGDVAVNQNLVADPLQQMNQQPAGLGIYQKISRDSQSN